MSKIKRKRANGGATITLSFALVMVILCMFTLVDSSIYGLSGIQTVEKQLVFEKPASSSEKLDTDAINNKNYSDLDKQKKLYDRIKHEFILINSTFKDLLIHFTKINATNCDEIDLPLSYNTPCYMNILNINNPKQLIHIPINYEVTDNENFESIDRNIEFLSNVANKTQFKTNDLLMIDSTGGSKFYSNQIDMYLSNRTTQGEIISLDDIINQRTYFNKIEIGDIIFFIVPNVKEKSSGDLVIDFDSNPETGSYYILENVFIE